VATSNRKPLPQVFRDLVYRLRSSTPLGTKEVISIAAAQHGVARRKQGYTAAMLVEESRMLQVSIFQILQNNLVSIDFSVLLIGVMTIADEADSQLSQAHAIHLRCSACLRGGLRKATSAGKRAEEVAT
jgi:hypothetical protein